MVYGPNQEGFSLPPLRCLSAVFSTLVLQLAVPQEDVYNHTVIFASSEQQPAQSNHQKEIFQLYST